MRLTEEQRRILRVIECAADAPLHEIAKRAKMRPHVARYHLKQLKDHGILRERIFINTYRLGYTRYALFFSLPGQKGAARKELIEKLKKHDRVALLLELGGEFQFEINLVVRHTFELQEFVSWMSKECGVALAGKAVGVQLNHRLYGTKCLWSEAKNLPELCYEVVPASVKIDETDHQILMQFRENAPTLRDISKAIGMAVSTVELRLKRMRENGIIAGMTYVWEGLPLLSWALLMHTNGLEVGLREEVVTFARAHPLIHYSVELLGSWDMELGIVSEDPLAPTHVIEDIYRKWGARIVRVQALPLFIKHKVVDYPFIKYNQS